MNAKPVVESERARQDVDASIVRHVEEAGRAVALAFIDDLQATYDRISGFPAAGSPRYAHALDLPGLRNRTLSRFPFLVFYREETDIVDVWRVLHAHRDLPALVRSARSTNR